MAPLVTVAPVPNTEFRNDMEAREVAVPLMLGGWLCPPLLPGPALVAENCLCACKPLASC